MKRFSLIIPLIAVAIAIVQLVTVQNSEFSRWKGGGFGMYTEPHPEAARIVRLEITTGNQIESIRLKPADERAKKIFTQLDSSISKKINPLKNELLGYASMPSDSTGNAMLNSLIGVLETFERNHGIIVGYQTRSYRLSMQEISLSISASTWNKRQIHAIAQ